MPPVLLETLAAVAERITAEALKFVATCAQFTGEGLRPSRVVDEGWHGLILRTAPYAWLCRRLSHFVHHRPERRDPTRYIALSWSGPWDASSAPGSRWTRDCGSLRRARRSRSSCFDGGPN